MLKLITGCGVCFWMIMDVYASHWVCPCYPSLSTLVDLCLLPLLFSMASVQLSSHVNHIGPRGTASFATDCNLFSYHCTVYLSVGFGISDPASTPPQTPPLLLYFSHCLMPPFMSALVQWSPISMIRTGQTFLPLSKKVTSRSCVYVCLKSMLLFQLWRYMQ